MFFFLNLGFFTCISYDIPPWSDCDCLAGTIELMQYWNFNINFYILINLEWILRFFLRFSD